MKKVICVECGKVIKNAATTKKACGSNKDKTSCSYKRKIRLEAERRLFYATCVPKRKTKLIPIYEGDGGELTPEQEKEFDLKQQEQGYKLITRYDKSLNKYLNEMEL